MITVRLVFIMVTIFFTSTIKAPIFLKMYPFFTVPGKSTKSQVIKVLHDVGDFCFGFLRFRASGCGVNRAAVALQRSIPSRR